MAATATTNSLSSGSGDEDWFFAGLASSYPNITSRISRESYFKLAWPQPCGKAAPATAAADHPDLSSGEKQQEQLTPGCRVFHPKTTSPAVEEIGIDAAPGEDAWAMREQVVVFRYEGAFHAVDHACPHRSYSLAWGQPFDIEDAARGGAVVGRGIRCRGHSYAFELSTGAGDRGTYKLGVWEVEVRPYRGGGDGGIGGVVLGDGADEEAEKEVWVRRRRKEA